MTRTRTFLIALLFLALPRVGVAQRRAPAISTDSLRVALYALAHDSMGGRQTGEIGDWKAQEWIAGGFGSSGLRPAGDNGTFFQVIPFQRVFADTSARITVGEISLAEGRDFMPISALVNWPVTGVRAVFGGWVDRPETWVDSATAAGRLLVLGVPDAARDFRGIFTALAPARQ